MYKRHSILIALVMLSASCFHYAVAVNNASTDAQDHHQHGGHPHRRAHPANVAVNSSSSEGSQSAVNLSDPLIVDLSWLLRDLAAKYNITKKTNNSTEELATHRSSTGRKRAAAAAHPGCCG